MRRALFVAAVVAATVTGSAGAALAAGAPETPNGYVGSCNMMLAPSMMTRVMETISAQGMEGMMGSHVASGCTT